MERVTGYFFLPEQVTAAKTYVQNLAGPIRNSSFQSYRVAKVTGCAAWLATEMRSTFDEFKKPSGTSGLTWKLFDARLELLEKGLKHELAMCQLVEDNGFSFIKRFEGHERVPKDYRKRAKAVSIEIKKEKQAAKPKPATPAKPKQEQAPAPKKPRGCWNCEQFGHHRRDCPLPPKNRGK